MAKTPSQSAEGNLFATMLEAQSVECFLALIRRVQL